MGRTWGEEAGGPRREHPARFEDSNTKPEKAMKKKGKTKPGGKGRKGC